MNITSAEVRRRLGVRYGRSSGNVVVPEHMVLFEVGARQSDWKRRRIDVVAVGLLKRSDYLIHGFEVKVSRSDLLSELREPAKAASAQRYCDRWWLALSTTDLLKDSDKVPKHWGIIACSGRGMKVHRQPQPIARVESPEFRAALLHAGQRSPGYRWAMGYQAGIQRGRDETRRFYHQRESQLHAMYAATARARETA
jgi:hypothetical protein